MKISGLRKSFRCSRVEGSVVTKEMARKKLRAGMEGCVLVEGCREVVSRQRGRVKEV